MSPAVKPPEACARLGRASAARRLCLTEPPHNVQHVRRPAPKAFGHFGCRGNPAFGDDSRSRRNEGGRRANLWASRAESAHKKDDKAYQQKQAKPAAADDGTAKVKPAAAEQEKKNYHEQ